VEASVEDVVLLGHGDTTDGEEDAELRVAALGEGSRHRDEAFVRLTGELSLEEEGRGGERGGERERKGRGEGKKGCRREEGEGKGGWDESGGAAVGRPEEGNRM
jgi:hypothetical protein